MQAYCREVMLVPNPYGREGLAKRPLQLRSLASTRSFERLRVTVPAFQQALDQVLRARRFDVVNLEFPYLGHLRPAPVTARRKASARGRRFARDRLRPRAAVRRNSRQPSPPPLRRRQLAQAQARGARDLSRGRRRLSLQRRRREAPARSGPRGSNRGHSQRGGCRFLPTASHRPAARRKHLRLSSACSPPYPTSTALHTSSGTSGRASRRRTRTPAARSSATGRHRRFWPWPGLRSS